MGKSYDEILGTMREAYYSETGVYPNRCGDTDIKLRLLAGELYALNSNIDWLKNQMFPLTATGEQLDYHAMQRGLSRISGSKAEGLILFQLTMPLDHNVIIPEGTICTTADGSLNFTVSQEGTILAGTSYTYILAQAEYSGKQYNVGPGAVTTIVTSFSVGLSVSNSTAFSGGTDDESDDELRSRLISHMRTISNGVNKQYYIDLARSVEGIYSAQAVENTQTQSVMLYAAARGGQTTDAVLAQVRSLVDNNRPLGIRFTVCHPEVMNYDVSVSILPAAGYTFAQVQQNVNDALNDFFNNLSIGQGVTLAELGAAIIGAEGVANYVFGASMSDKLANDGFLWYLGTVTITAVS